MAPRIVKLLKGNKRKNNQGPNQPITRKEVEKAGSLENVYMTRGEKAPESFAGRVASRVASQPVPKIGEKPKSKMAFRAEKIARKISPEAAESLRKKKEALKYE